MEKLHEARLDKYLKFGPIVREVLSGTPVVHLFHPDDFAKVFRSQGKHPIRPPAEFVRHYRSRHPDRYPTIGIAHSNGDEWFNERQRLAPVLLKLGITENHIPTQNVICNDFVQYLKCNIQETRDRESFVIPRIQEVTSRLALESIASLCLDIRMGVLRQTSSIESDKNSSQDTSTSMTGGGEVLIKTTRKLFESYNKLYYGIPVWKLHPSLSTSYKEYSEAEEEIYNLAYHAVQEKMRRKKVCTPRQNKTLENDASHVNYVCGHEGDIKNLISKTGHQVSCTRSSHLPKSSGHNTLGDFIRPKQSHHVMSRSDNDSNEKPMLDINNVFLNDKLGHQDTSSLLSSSSLFDTLLNRDDFDDRHIPITVIDFITGGTFAASNSLTYLLYHLSHHQDVQEKLFQELYSVLKSKNNSSLDCIQKISVSTEDLSHMPYLKAVIKESFRLSPVIPAVVRILSQDTILSGYKVPKGVSTFIL